MNHRNELELLWRAAVSEVGGHAAVSKALANATDPSWPKPDYIIAIGKAATPMLEAALAFAGYDTNALLITKYGHFICHHKANQARLEEYQGDGTLTLIEAGHPVPDENSMAGGQAMMDFVRKMEKQSHLLMLVSGGASALAELPDDEVSLAALQEMTNDKLAQGLDIEAINRWRKDISLIKDGKLLSEFTGAYLRVLAISDVEGDDIGIIGSGIGSGVRLGNKAGEATAVSSQIVASNKIARNACASKAKMLGFDLCANDELAYGDVNSVANTISKILIDGPAGVYIFGGEPTVVLPDNPGRGGRNQQLALLLAKNISGIDGIEILVGGTDGSDGPTDAAGGFANADSFNVQPGGNEALSRADAGRFLQETGNLFVTGPTGTNVMDLVIAIKSPVDDS